MYYLIRGFLVPLRRASDSPAHNRARGGRAPGSLIAPLPQGKRLTVAAISNEHGLLAFRAGSLAEAYTVADATIGIFTLFGSWSLELPDSEWRLFEIRTLPRRGLSDDTLVSRLERDTPSFDQTSLHALRSGLVIRHDIFGYLRRYLPLILQTSTLRNGLLHFSHSRTLYSYPMDAGYYHLHYVNERTAQSAHVREKRSLQFRLTLELAFVAAFKAVEAVFGSPGFRAADICRLLTKLDIKDFQPDDRYVRHHECFTGLPVNCTVATALKRFLELRNAVAAHANSNAPPHLLISEDSLLELQLFVEILLDRVLADAAHAAYEPAP